MTLYILFCLVFGITSYLSCMNIKVYNGLTYVDIVLMIAFGIFTPIFIIIALATWCSNQIKTI